MKAGVSSSLLPRLYHRRRHLRHRCRRHRCRLLRVVIVVLVVARRTSHVFVLAPVVAVVASQILMDVPAAVVAVELQDGNFVLASVSIVVVS